MKTSISAQEPQPSSTAEDGRPELVRFTAAEMGGPSPLLIQRETIDMAERRADQSWAIYFANGSSVALQNSMRMSFDELTARLFPERHHAVVRAIGTVCGHLVNPSGVLSVTAVTQNRVDIQLRGRTFILHTIKPHACSAIVAALYGEEASEGFDAAPTSPTKNPPDAPLSIRVQAHQRAEAREAAIRREEAEFQERRKARLAPVTSSDPKVRNPQIWHVVNAIDGIMNFANNGHLWELPDVRPRVLAFDERKTALRHAAIKLRREDSQANLDAVCALIEGMTEVMKTFPRVQGVAEMSALYTEQLQRLANLQPTRIAA